MFSSPYMPVRYYLLQGSLTCPVVTLRSSVLNLYWVNSEITSAVINLDTRSSPSNYASLA